ncbi:MAG TPA: stage III sporulation protein AD [Bacillota bacterium]|jgi:stage III sporulation protein AD|nr:stage III sporulation protein AD [Bacillota bacterium]HRS21244.1 stage III sporulation protein AD [Clostridia bacterium]HRU41329.1 stage III sporulation protein AD [Candidatus Diapherotrites archaeon]HQE65506.1 stage III sporulation protein AD [Bacillota bacterium]HQI15662.1 stage III sporulation protein AD [Bacillota bacterium]
MDIMKIVMVGIIAALLAVVLKEEKPEMAVAISIVTGLVIFVFVITKLNSVMMVLKHFAAKANIDILYFSTILKVIAIAYITEFGAQICRDAGEGAIAAKIEFAGKVLIMVIAIPILAALMDIMIKIIP